MEPVPALLEKLARLSDPELEGSAAPRPAAPEAGAAPFTSGARCEAVGRRAGHRCEFVGGGTAGGAARRAPGVGRRCTARAGLEPDHYPVPWSVSRSSDPAGIRVHCPAHNSLTAREYFGEEPIDRNMAAERERRRAGRERGKDLGGGTGRG